MVLFKMVMMGSVELISCKTTVRPATLANTNKLYIKVILWRWNYILRKLN